MMLHKIFHMNQSVDETKRRLENVSGYRHHLDGVECADMMSDGTSKWRLQLPLGFRAEFVLKMVSLEDGTGVAFTSVGGDLEIAGIVVFHRIQSNLTEVDVTLNYDSSSALFNMFDRMLNVGDQFLVNQLRRVRAHFEGIAAPARERVQIYSSQFKPIAA